MHKKRFFLTLCFIMSIYAVGVQAKIISQKHVFYGEESINGVIFTHTITTEFGKTEEKYTVDKVPVLKDDFEHQLEAAHLTELRLARKAEQARQASKAVFSERSQLLILEKLIKKSLAEVTGLLDKVNKEALKPYFVFNKNSITCMQELVDIATFVQETTRELPSLSKQGDAVLLNSILSQLESFPVKIEQLFKDSVQNAIKHCDDTELLKQLLNLLSE